MMVDKVSKRVESLEGIQKVGTLQRAWIWWMLLWRLAILLTRLEVTRVRTHFLAGQDGVVARVYIYKTL